MKILPEPATFEWDAGNIDKNFIRHKVSSREAEEIFENVPRFIFKDESHSQNEERYGIFGKTNEGRMLSIVFTLRNNNIRIITARDMSKKERSVYEQKIKTNPKV